MGELMNRFNWLAANYDLLARVVFGKSLYHAQLFYLRDVPQHANVLIIGGGTGWLLKELLLINPLCRIWYIEASSTMIKQAKQKIKKINRGQVCFIHGTQDSIPDEIGFDVVITNFFLDLFSPGALESVIERIKLSLPAKALWLVSDFKDQHKKWQKALLRLMYFFFRITCGIEARVLPDWETKLGNAGLVELKNNSFFNGFVKTSVWGKTISE